MNQKRDFSPTQIGDHVIDVDELVQAFLDEAATSSDEGYARGMRDASLMLIARVVR